MHTNELLVLLIVAYARTNGIQDVENGLVRIRQGLLRGRQMVSTHGRKFYAFRGIPYAKPPLGELRFQRPLPAENWEGIYNATEDGKKCPQLNLWTFELSYDEDCLTLNVNTPRLPNINNSRKSQLPVLVYIHEGLFAAGEASSTNKPPQRLMNKDVVLVLIQYRLGPLGFLSTNDSASPGNLGLHDQVLALKWVKQNIGAFGGDANQVTISGQSAGGSAVIYHLLSPLSKGLFRGAIAQSGSALHPWAFQKDPLPWAIKLGEEVHCPTNVSVQLVDCLRQKSVQEIINAAVQIKAYVLEIGPFVPVVENSIQNDAFITDTPLKLAEQGKWNEVPLITGFTKDEAAGLFYGPSGKLFEVIDENFYKEILPAQLKLLTKYSGDLTNLTAAVKKLYFDIIDVENRTQVIDTVTNLYTDIAYKAGIDLTTRKLAARNVPVFMYSFEYAGNVSETNFTGQKQIQHEDDLYYIFNRTQLSARDLAMSDRIVEMWTNFVTNLNPTPNQCGFTWTPSPSTEELWYLEIGEDGLKMKQGYLTQRMNFWNNVAPTVITN